MSEEAKAKDDGGKGILKGLQAIDESIIKSGQNGPPGSGLFYLLETLAGQFMGTPRLGYPVDKPPVVDKPKEQEPEKKEPESKVPPGAPAGRK
jgi:hypothetical protein